MHYFLSFKLKSAEQEWIECTKAYKKRETQKSCENQMKISGYILNSPDSFTKLHHFLFFIQEDEPHVAMGIMILVFTMVISKGILTGALIQ